MLVLLYVTTGYVLQAPSTSTVQLKSSAMFAEMSKRLTPEIVKKIGAVYQFNVTVDGKVAQTWSELLIFTAIHIKNIMSIDCKTHCFGYSTLHKH